MNARLIFTKRKSHRKLIISFICLVILLYFIYFFIFKNNNEFIVIPENIDNFYIIPKDRGGEKILNLDKKSLNLITEEFDLNSLDRPINLAFSIQFYVDSNFENIKKYLKKLINIDETIYFLDDFYILEFNSDIGKEYFLLYKNFTSRLDAENYCINFMPKIDKCIVVDTVKF